MICVNKGKIVNLTFGKRYEVVRTISGIHQGSNITYKGFYVINDAGIEKYYSSKRFLEVSEVRDIKLKQLGI